MKRMLLQEFGDALRSGAVPTEPVVLQHRRSDSRGLPVKVLRVASGGVAGSPVVVTFHGAVARASREIPVFQNLAVSAFEGQDVSLIAIADPSLECGEALSVAWYAGDSEFDTPASIARLLDCIEALGTPRLVLAGASIGGHPALYHGAHRGNCAVVVANPVVSMSAYTPVFLKSYLKRCWPDVEGPDALADKVCMDVAEKYAEGHQSALIYLQNAKDHGKADVLRNQALAFASKVRDYERFLFECGYLPGAVGHSYPSTVFGSWVSAAVRSPSLDVVEIARRRISVQDEEKAPVARKASHMKSDDDEILRARAVARHLLGDN